MPDLRRLLTAALAIQLLATASCARGGNATERGAKATPTTPSAARGAALFSANCAACHGSRGVAGRIGPSLRDERKRKSAAAIRAAIVDPEPPMPKLYPAQLTAQDVDDLTAYVETL
jgi:mono/diheme cytochrome c family protein